jgi:hypothetical protein
MSAYPASTPGGDPTVVEATIYVKPDGKVTLASYRSPRAIQGK